VAILIYPRKIRGFDANNQGWVSSQKKGISSLPMGRNRFLPGKKPFFREETPKGHRVCDNNQLIW